MPDGPDQELQTSQGLDGLAWLFGMAEFVASAPSAARDEATKDTELEAPPRAA